ncbi:hypothetical protein GCM10023084_44800 [Streptomyces lacrimifluminis]|uniref:Uncharacterized protein n=1 Tax=Streptomyces lacrimifluminis TaxID=1500077 RepID=A0A917L5C2_9ACTN|nr:hypothetical protein GCM10012282_48040 [Streptomyces lacrimifluminis]
MPPGDCTVATAAEAVPVVATLRTTELKRTASAVAVEVLRIRTVMNPHKRTRDHPGAESAARHPGATAGSGGQWGAAARRNPMACL